MWAEWDAKKMFLWLVYREDYFGFACLMLGKFGKSKNIVLLRWWYNGDLPNLVKVKKTL